MGDGHLSKCKPCTIKDANKHRWDNIEKVREYDRRRGNRQAEGYLKSWREKYPQKYKAISAVNNAVRDGRLEKATSCEECGHDQVIGHHDDYLKPLDVRWLCQACHKQWHRDNGQGANGSYKD